MAVVWRKQRKCLSTVGFHSAPQSTVLMRLATGYHLLPDASLPPLLLAGGGVVRDKRGCEGQIIGYPTAASSPKRWESHPGVGGAGSLSPRILTHLHNSPLGNAFNVLNQCGLRPRTLPERVRGRPPFYGAVLET